MKERYTASIDGYVLDCETIQDEVKKSIAKYEYPYRDGADTEDMGENAWGMKIRCYFLEERYEKHIEFLNHLKSQELFELTHPVYGIKKGRIESVSARHDERDETAEIDIDFVEDISTQDADIVIKHIDPKGETEEGFINGQTEHKASFEKIGKDAIGPDAGDIMSRTLDPAKGILEQFSGVSNKGRAWLKTVETYVTRLQASASNVSNPANSLVSMIDYGANLPGRVIGSLARAVERYALLFSGLKDSPERYFQNLQNSIDDLAASSEFPSLTRTAGAQRMAVEAAQIYAADEQTRNIQRRRETSTVQAFDAEGNYIEQEPAGQILSMRQLELSLAEVRSAIQVALDTDRTAESLKAQARTLLEYVMVIKLERDRMVTILLDNPMPIHLVCMQRGLSYDYAERILAINDIPQPNFTSGEITIYA